MPDRMQELDALISGSRSWAVAELARVGWNRHRRRTKPLKHGKRHTYNVGCRCEFCVAANRDYCRLWHQENKEWRTRK